jgi:hypothetical protein
VTADPPPLLALTLLPEDVAGLRRKYEEIRRLRFEAASNGDVDPRRHMATLAAEFPGALRETDALPIHVIEKRIAALQAVEAASEDAAPWMLPMARFHALTRGALCAKKWLRGRKEVDELTRADFEREANAFCYAADARAWRADLARIASPPRGRVTDLVLERIARELGVDEEAVRQWLFSEVD